MPRNLNITPHNSSTSSVRSHSSENTNNSLSNRFNPLAKSVRKVSAAESKAVRDKIKVSNNKDKSLPMKKQSDDEQCASIWTEWGRQAYSTEAKARQKTLQSVLKCLSFKEEHLELSGRYLRSIPILPDHIKKLTISFTELTELPQLPAGLEELNCFGNKLVKLPELPSGLKILNSSNNPLVNLPKLPNGLKELDCSKNSLNCLPIIPTGLKVLCCNDNHLECLSELPVELDELSCCNNKLVNLPELPNGLKALKYSNNKLTNLRNLPPSLESLDVGYNELTELPELPTTLKELYCSKNQLERLPTLPASIVRIEVNSNHLTEIPELPTALKELYCNGNQLERLPTLPASIVRIEVNSNHLTELPELPTALEGLYCNGNPLERLPTLPASIMRIEVNSNHLTELPELPASLEVLQCAHNQITRVPESITYPRDYFGNLDIRNNPLSERIIQNFLAFHNDTNYRGLRLSFSMPSQYTSERPVRPLTESVPYWFSDEHKQEIMSTFVPITNEEYAGAFSAFIDRLQHTSSAKKDPMFKQRVAQWLTQLADSPELRKASFVVALGATESCEDRVALTWNDMQKVELIHNIEVGQYDDRLPELVTAGREMFRLEQLEHIAREKVATLYFVDEIEVYLGFQTQLRIPLELTNTAKEMRFFGVSGITASDLNVAELRVKTAENQQFPEWLAQWAPWQKLVERTEPTLWENACDKKMDIYENEFQNRINAELAASGLIADADAERAIGVKVMHNIDKAIFTPLTQIVLANKKQESLLNQQWDI
ncbi:NEL-type E3 ubiquitin ligase domain-containing protein [Providencia burhodogranariea]|uniref:RING-type E3 ubiquitin transferase n=1 Tax=Providencia burhodogranariea DSM 19968 TaxID=1141662 RepID=K8WVG7_9GAMM|nr:NEL-type E3 ubiquitin ligase domain-containing protein [Providencia burhodogranariea]EKT64593.1 leucine-rich repeat protein [Providencia burhodogranariea DSM 19968]